MKILFPNQVSEKAVEGGGISSHFSKNVNAISVPKEEVMKMPEMDMNSPQHNHPEMEQEKQIKR